MGDCPPSTKPVQRVFDCGSAALGNMRVSPDAFRKYMSNVFEDRRRGLALTPLPSRLRRRDGRGMNIRARPWNLHVGLELWSGSS
jgi:hypothetical protein